MNETKIKQNAKQLMKANKKRILCSAVPLQLCDISWILFCLFQPELPLALELSIRCGFFILTAVLYMTLTALIVRMINNKNGHDSHGHKLKNLFRHFKLWFKYTILFFTVFFCVFIIRIAIDLLIIFIIVGNRFYDSLFFEIFGIVLCVISVIAFFFQIYILISFSMSFSVIAEDESFGVFSAHKKSLTLVRAHRSEIFEFELGFIGWYLLSVITLGVALIWTLPYYIAANYYMYKEMEKSFEQEKDSGRRFTEMIERFNQSV